MKKKENKIKNKIRWVFDKKNIIKFIKLIDVRELDYINFRGDDLTEYMTYYINLDLIPDADEYKEYIVKDLFLSGKEKKRKVINDIKRVFKQNSFITCAEVIKK